jgi:hypothetical protein
MFRGGKGDVSLEKATTVDQVPAERNRPINPGVSHFENNPIAGALTSTRIRSPEPLSYHE